MFDGVPALSMPIETDNPVPDRDNTGMVERLVRAEMKIEGLREDTRVIRENIHGIRNEMQGFVAAEMQCQHALNAINTTLTDWKPLIQSMVADQGERKGVRVTWGHIGVIGTILATGATAIIAALALLLQWHIPTPK
jgi:hypothetical protein